MRSALGRKITSAARKTFNSASSREIIFGYKAVFVAAKTRENTTRLTRCSGWIVCFAVDRPGGSFSKFSHMKKL